MIVQDVKRDGNQNGRVAGMFGDGVYTRYIEIINDVIVICDSDMANGQPVERHRNYDLAGRNFAARSITTRRSGFDGKLLVTVGGFTPDTGDSRRITIKCDLQIDPAV